MNLDLSKSQGYEITVWEGRIFGVSGWECEAAQLHPGSETQRSITGSRDLLPSWGLAFLVYKMTEFTQVTQSPEFHALTLVTTLSSW